MSGRFPDHSVRTASREGSSGEAAVLAAVPTAAPGGPGPTLPDALRSLLVEGRQRGLLTRQQLLEAVGQAELSLEAVEDLVLKLRDEGIEVIEVAREESAGDPSDADLLAAEEPAVEIAPAGPP
ncbi:MAG TPA: RNA polymerase sigma factor region1.1 domain-containing protein, partial [Acidimicrobiales bacterium]|nr:RNA polymerase sigma factor region1.1 domain-containing protein [Acidimicrobiales bacterium]